MDQLVRKETHRCLPCAVETVLETVKGGRNQMTEKFVLLKNLLAIKRQKVE